MDIKKALSEDTIILGLKGETKEDVISEIVDHLVACGKIQLANRDKVLEAIMEREKKMSTGMQNGIAIPHGKTDGVTGLVAALATKKTGVDFNALDGQPSRIFVMTISPINRTGPHIQFLAEISRLLNDPEAQHRILDADTKEEIIAIL